MPEFMTAQAFYAQIKIDDNWVDIITGHEDSPSPNGDGWYPIYMPSGIQCEEAIIQCQPNAGFSSYDPWAECVGFLFAPPENVARSRR